MRSSLRNLHKSRISDPGFGEKVESHSKRIINPDGTFNIERVGVEGGLRNFYIKLLGKSNGAFFLFILSGYLIISLAFAVVYWAIGAEYMTNVLGETPIQRFMDCFFFSTQTFTTVGYGAIAPKGILTSAVASFEAFMGLVFFALATGLMYTRFSKPRATLVYSNNALIAPYLDGEAFMFRIANERTNVLMQMEAKLILSMREADAAAERKYYNLTTEIDKVLFLAMSWTLVHKIDEDSPLWGVAAQELLDMEAEVLILLSGYDDTFNQTVHSKHSYTASEVVWKAKFKRPYRTEPSGRVIMDVGAIHDYEKL